MKKLIVAIAMIGFGTFAMAQKSPEQKATMEAKKEQMQAKAAAKRAANLEKMKIDLNLNEAQFAKIKANHEEMASYKKVERQNQIAMRKEAMSRMKVQRETMNAEMKNILTPEQFSKWETQREDRKMKMKNTKKMKMNKREKMNKANS